MIKILSTKFFEYPVVSRVMRLFVFFLVFTHYMQITNCSIGWFVSNHANAVTFYDKIVYMHARFFHASHEFIQSLQSFIIKWHIRCIIIFGSCKYLQFFFFYVNRFKFRPNESIRTIRSKILLRIFLSCLSSLTPSNLAIKSMPWVAV